MASPDPFGRIHTLLRTGDYRAALKLLYDPSKDQILEPFHEDLNHAWYVVGNIHYRTGDQSRAVDAFSRSLEERPDDLEAILALGNAYSQDQKYQLCEQTLRRGLAIDPHHDHLLYNLGNALFDQGRYENAIAVYSRVSHQDELLFMKAKRNIRVSEERKGDRDA